LRRAIRERLASADRELSANETLTIDDARHLIARSEGFTDWSALVASTH
jgi:hypothetical protein